MLLDAYRVALEQLRNLLKASHVVARAAVAKVLASPDLPEPVRSIEPNDELTMLDFALRVDGEAALLVRDRLVTWINAHSTARLRCRSPVSSFRT